MKKLMIVLMIGSAIWATSVFAAEDPIATRKAMMQNVSAATKMGAAMLKGQMDYSPVAGQLVLRVMNQATLGVGELFPKGSESGGKTTASPKIWEDMAGFKAALAKFQQDTASEIMKPEETEFFDKDSFMAAFVKVTKNCGVCHKVYRIPQN